MMDLFLHIYHIVHVSTVCHLFQPNFSVSRRLQHRWFLAFSRAVEAFHNWLDQYLEQMYRKRASGECP